MSAELNISLEELLDDLWDDAGEPVVIEDVEEAPTTPGEYIELDLVWVPR